VHRFQDDLFPRTLAEVWELFRFGCIPRLASVVSRHDDTQWRKDLLVPVLPDGVRDRHRARNKHHQNKNGLPARPEEHSLLVRRQLSYTDSERVVRQRSINRYPFPLGQFDSAGAGEILVSRSRQPFALRVKTSVLSSSWTFVVSAV
jgi:hypothetical protein